MIRINLLQSAVENTNLDVVENAISNKGTQQTLLLLIAAGACILAIGLDFFITRRDNSRVKAEVDVAQATADRLQQVTKQAQEIQDKNKAVEERITAIMRLRSEQVGPLRLLQMVDSKLPEDNSFRLVSVKQEIPPAAPPPAPGAKAEAKPADAVKLNNFIINGYSPSEAQVISFAKNIEFADGWFSKFTIETRRIANPEFKEAGPGVPAKNVQSKVAREAYQFTIRCSYNPQNILVNPTIAAQANNTPAPAQPAAPPVQ